MKKVLIICFTILMSGRSNCEEIGAARLGAEIQNAKAITGKTPTITLEFVLKNLTDEPIKLAPPDNSWGYRQWSFTLVDKAGNQFVFERPERDWLSNVFGVFTIAPKGRETMAFKLCLDDPEKDFQAFFVKTRGVKRPWLYPVRLVGTFSASQIHKMDQNDSIKRKGISTNWTGSVSTPPINIEGTEQIADGKTPDALEPLH